MASDAADPTHHRWFVVSAAVCVLAFAWVITGGTGRLFEAENFGNFYDYQAAGLLHGRLDVPREVIGVEAFVFEGKSYGYFGPTPALLRIPFNLLGLGFGRLSRAFMLVYFTAGLIAVYLILLEAIRLARGAKAAPGRSAIVLLTFNAGLGSTLFFLGSRASIYHEAILCGAAFALWAVWFALRHFAASGARWWIGGLVCGILSVHARAPTGFFALCLLGTVAVFLGIRAWREPRVSGGRADFAALRRAGTIGLLSAAGILSFNGVSYLKFGTIEGCPLRLNVQYDAKRLAHIDNRQFHAANIPFNLDAYLFHRSYSFSPYFPWFRVGASPRKSFPNAKIDLVDPIAGFPVAMPALCVLASLGCAGAFVRLRPLRVPIALLWLSVLPMTFAMLAAIAVTQRYTADFCPFLLAAGAFGLAMLDGMTPGWRRVSSGAIALLTAFGVFITSMITLRLQGEGTWGVSQDIRRNYSQLCRRVDTFFGLANPRGYSPDPAEKVRLASELARQPEHIKDAIAVFETAMEMDPGNLETYYQLAELLLTLPDLPQSQLRAVSYYETVLKTRPNIAEVHNNVAIAYYRTGDLTAAIEHLNLALKINPEFRDAQVNLEQILAVRKTQK